MDVTVVLIYKGIKLLWMGGWEGNHVVGGVDLFIVVYQLKFDGVDLEAVVFVQFILENHVVFLYQPCFYLC